MQKARFILLILILLHSASVLAQPSYVGNHPSGRWNVAIVVHDRVEVLDFAGPAEVFTAAAHGRAFHVYTVAPKPGLVQIQRFSDLLPDYTIENCPPPDIVIIPGGDTTVLRRDAKFIEWVRTVAGDADVILSVCTGAFAPLPDGSE